MIIASSGRAVKLLLPPPPREMVPMIIGSRPYLSLR